MSLVHTYGEGRDQLREWWQNARDNIARLPIRPIFQVLKKTATLIPVDQLSDAIELGEQIVDLINTVPKQREKSDALTTKITELLIDICASAEDPSGTQWGESGVGRTIAVELCAILDEQRKWIEDHAVGTKWFIHAGEFEDILSRHTRRVQALIERFQTQALKYITNLQVILLQKTDEHRRTLQRLEEQNQAQNQILTNIALQSSANAAAIMRVDRAISEILNQNVNSVLAPENIGVPGDTWHCVKKMSTPYEVEPRWLSFKAEELVDQNTTVQVEVHMLNPTFVDTEERRQKALTRFSRCEFIWREISKAHHPFVMSLQGAYQWNSHFPQPHFKHEYISETAQTFFSKKLSHNIDRVKFIYQLAIGVNHLHRGIVEGMKVVHARVMPAYIYISDKGTPLLSNVNMASIITQNEPHESSATTVPDEGKIYLAPEALGLEAQFGLDSTQGDVYSWAATSVKILTGEAPFTQGSTNLRNFLGRLKKDNYVPTKLEDFPDFKLWNGAKVVSHAPENACESQERKEKLWQILDRCWAFDRLQRPDIKKVIEELETFRPDLKLGEEF